MKILYIKRYVSADFGEKAVTYENCKCPEKMKRNTANYKSKFQQLLSQYHLVKVAVDVLHATNKGRFMSSLLDNVLIGLG